ncbi:hypothetical protein GCM10010104_24060 [Streptomyces indiaensis]|uniref:XRE family transcriptional regulator n=1 Tax=Streptomyces indiaensis TaxID=284033 RepID=A0ABP5QA46_9ACTN
MPGEPLAVHPLSLLRQTRGWGKAEFAPSHAGARAVTRNPARDQPDYVWKWEQGQEPDADAQRVLADLLSVPYEQARREGWPGGSLPRGLRPVPLRRCPNSWGVVTGLLASWVDAPSAFASALGGDQVTDTMVSTIEQRISMLRTLDDQLGGATLLEQARGDLALSTCRYTESIRLRLYALAARVSHLTCWMAYDAGLPSAGQRYYVGALRSARTAGDDAFGAFILAEMGVHVSEAGRTTERVELT